MKNPRPLVTDPPSRELVRDCSQYPQGDETRIVPLYDTVQIQSGSGFPVKVFDQPSDLPRIAEALEALKLADNARTARLERW